MYMGIKKVLGRFKTALFNFFSDDCFTLGASISFFTILSLAPLFVILLAVAAFIGQDAQQALVGQVTQLVGNEAGAAVEEIIENAEQKEETGALSAAAGILMLLFGATGVFNQLQKSMNRIWDVPERPGHEIAEWFRKRMLSVAMVVAIGFLLLVSLVLNAAVSFLIRGEGIIWSVISNASSFVVIVLMFAAMFKILPDVIIGWRDVWLGAFMTGLLFVVGQFGISKYLGASSVGSSYGAAGSLVVLLVWIYYASLIVMFGTELTEAYATSLRPVQWSDDPKEKIKGEKEPGNKSS